MFDNKSKEVKKLNKKRIYGWNYKVKTISFAICRFLNACMHPWVTSEPYKLRTKLEAATTTSTTKTSTETGSELDFEILNSSKGKRRLQWIIGRREEKKQEITKLRSLSHFIPKPNFQFEFVHKTTQPEDWIKLIT
jgi:hypothetical protein